MRRMRGWLTLPKNLSRVVCGRGRNREAQNSVGSNSEIVLRLKGERAAEVDVWTFSRRCRLL